MSPTRDLHKTTLSWWHVAALFKPLSYEAVGEPARRRFPLDGYETYGFVRLS